jgi:transcription antitermination protein NusB
VARSRAAAARSRARRLLLQALYQRSLTRHDAGVLLDQFRQDADYARADDAYFRELLFAIPEAEGRLDAVIQDCTDRPVAQLDPVEHAILRIGVYELAERREVPWRVVVNEGVELSHRFGAAEGHKFVNAVLDRAARTLRAGEASG